MNNSATRSLQRDHVSILAEDGVALAGTLFRGTGAGPAVLLSCAAAVEQRFYRAFAERLVTQGAQAVLTYDFRGVGGSRHRMRSRSFRMKDWGVRDFPAALTFLESHAAPGALVGIGHSFGGLAIGLSGVSHRFQRYAMVASLNGYYRRTREPLSVFMRMNFLGVPLTHALGRLPGSVGFGTELPGSIFRDWARWCRNPDFFFKDRSVPEAARFTDVRLPLLSVGIDDDPWGTPEAVGDLLERLPNAEIAELWLAPEDAGRPIGHAGFFRRENAAALWPPVVRFLIEGTRPPAASPGAWP